MKATIFNIQKFCLHDGPGIRTTIFFKGCPLKCLWCANPESQSTKIQLMKDKTKCIDCGTCNADNFTPSDCPHYCASVSGKEYTVDEVYLEAIKDIDFYNSSGGGVTFSGGEALMYTDFIEELSIKLREKNIHIAAETCGFSSHENFLKLCKSVDLFLFDVKHYDSTLHENFTGVKNDIILKNLQTAINLGKKVTARIPIIPDFNDSLEDMEHFGVLLKKLGVTKVNLLPFHQMGENKYEMIGKEYEMKSYKQLNEGDLVEHLEAIKKYIENASF